MFSDTNLALVYHVYVKKFYKELVENDDANKENSADATAVIPPKNKEVLHALDIIRRRLQFKGENMDTFFRLERKMQDSMQNKIKQTAITQYFA